MCALSPTSGGSSRFSSHDRLENPALFGAIADAAVRDAMRGQVDRFTSADADRTRAPAGESHDRAQCRGAPRAVAAKQRDDLAAVHRQIDTVQNVGLPVPRLQTRDLKRRSARRGAAHFEAFALGNCIHAWAPASAASALPI